MLEQIKELAVRAGKEMLTAFDIENKVSEKEGSANFVTQYDVAIQNLLEAQLHRILPEAQFLGEENGSSADPSKGYCFIVDPIDGTTNFIHHYRHSCVSIGLVKDGEPVLGVVYNPYMDELFYAQRGLGAFLNGSPIHTSTRELADSLICFGTSPYYEHLTEPTFALAQKLFRVGRDLRRSGSAALDLCYVASGRCDLYFELILQPWDFAAGSVILTEAGGMICTVENGTLTLDRACSVLAANKAAGTEFFARTW